MSTEEKVRNFVKEKAINISALAKKMNMSYQTAYDMFSENGANRKIKADELLHFCAVMEVNPMQFRSDEVEE